MVVFEWCKNACENVYMATRRHIACNTAVTQIDAFKHFCERVHDNVDRLLAAREFCAESLFNYPPKAFSD